MTSSSGSLAAFEHHVDLAACKASERQVEVDIERANVSQLEPQDLDVPPGIERDLVVGEAKRLLLHLRQAGELDGRHFGQAHLPGRAQSPMAGDQYRLLVDETGLVNPNVADRGAELLDLPFGMGPRIAWIRLRSPMGR